jgi:mono/diheme cytochrome c family protein
MGMISLGAALCLGLTLLAQAQPSRREQGRYLVERVGICGDCHTPLGPTGEPVRAKWLKGATLTFLPTMPVPNWAKTAPDLTPGGAVLRSWGEKGLARFLETALDPSGKPANPPMPAYRMKTADAEAVVEYLKSLP